MKTQIGLIIGIVIGLAVGFGVGLYTGQVRNAGMQMQVAAVKQPTESPEMQAAKATLSELRVKFTDKHPKVVLQQARILALEENQCAK